jgi:hypothetical protein
MWTAGGRAQGHRAGTPLVADAASAIVKQDAFVILSMQSLFMISLT